jgi:hypothetical protein
MKQKSFKNNIFLFHKEEKIMFKKNSKKYALKEVPFGYIFIDEIVNIY